MLNVAIYGCSYYICMCAYADILQTQIVTRPELIIIINHFFILIFFFVACIHIHRSIHHHHLLLHNDYHRNSTNTHTYIRKHTHICAQTQAKFNYFFFCKGQKLRIEFCLCACLNVFSTRCSFFSFCFYTFLYVIIICLKFLFIFQINR